jgi:hypothetical protein
MTVTWTADFWYDDVTPMDHSVEGLATLIQQYKTLPRIEAFLVGLLNAIDLTDTAAYDVLALRSVYTATGVQLDTIGELVQQPRGELVDAAYRLFILGKILVNKADGLLIQLYEILERIGLTEDFWAHEYYPAALKVVATGVTYEEPTIALALLWKPAGVDFRFCTSTATRANTFKFSDDPINPATSNPGTGWANPAGTTGGEFVRESK